jgi:membrane protein DedA with SNARE-associated domain
MDKVFFYLTDLSGPMSYLIIFGVLVACGLGFPLPEDLPLIAAGYLVWDGTLEWFWAIVVTMVGVLIGDTIIFSVGKKMGVKVLQSGRVQSLIKPQKIRRVRAYFRKYGDKLVFFARFVAGFRAAAFFMAGAMKMKYQRFIFLDGMAALISVPVWIVLGYGLGYSFGEEISEILRQMKHLKTGFTIVVFAVVLSVFIRTYLRYRKAKLLMSTKGSKG